MTLTAMMLAKILHEEFDKDDWGDIDPSHFGAIAQGIDHDDDNADEHVALEIVLKRVAKRLDELK